jgi:hypothetical protein
MFCVEYLADTKTQTNIRLIYVILSEIINSENK